jgi:hypothetical protein
MRLWTPQESELARRLINERASDNVCQLLLDRTRQACRDRVNRIADKDAGITNATNHSVDTKFTKIPPEVIEDRNRRLNARMEMDLTGLFCGDPEPCRERL